MSKTCPKCGMEYFGVREYDTCLSCGWHRVTLFDRFIASPEVLAEKLVYCNVTVREYPGGVELTKGWYSTIIPKKVWSNEEEAIAATVAKLKEVYNG